MSAYPRMFALLDVKRTAAGLPALQPLESYAPHPVLESGTGNEETRYRRLDDLAAQFADDVAWLNRPVEGLDVEDDFRSIKFVLGKGSFDDYGIEVRLEATFRPSVPLALADRCAWASFHVPGGNYRPELTPENEAWTIIRVMLEALQPVYAFTTLDTDSPALPEDYAHFQRPWSRGSSSFFLGPDLTRLIPGRLLDPENGFSHTERLGAGVWLTVARAALFLLESDSEKAEAEQHHRATLPVWDFLESLSAETLL
ncbi:hypothetical protein [Deinococcus altitudinis]|uniref:hypothetical protein n=1 Tax=Deinococcus altitudinis TaxID=468914 RepID=UPI003891A5FE